MSTGGETSNPYHEARGIWNERYQNLIRARWNWQLIAFGELFVIIVFALALVWHASQSKVVPYVVRVDEAGQSLVIGPAQASRTTDPRIVGWQLQSFVRQVRQVTADRTAQKQLLDQAYQQAAGPAIAFLNTHFRDETTNPFERNRTQIVMPSVRRLLWTAPIVIPSSFAITPSGTVPSRSTTSALQRSRGGPPGAAMPSSARSTEIIAAERPVRRLTSRVGRRSTRMSSVV